MLCRLKCINLQVLCKKCVFKYSDKLFNTNNYFFI